MSKVTTRQLRERRHRRVRGKIAGTTERPRLAVFRSNRGIFAQLVDDSTGKTIAGASWMTVKGLKGNKTDQAREVGKAVAEAGRKAGVETVVFDRAGNRYAGRIAALADAARESGLEF